MIQYLFITNSPDLAEYAESCGVGRIFVDIETIGKYERQGHLDTLISRHSLEDIPKIKSRLKKIPLMVRLNPLHENTKYEVDSAISGGADLLMLPMFKTAEEVQLFADYVDGRAGIVPLLETYSATQCLQEIVKIKDIYQIHIGLNDLHLDMELDFMFEPLANGLVDNLADIIKIRHLSFGFGGIARIGEGVIPGEVVLAEHVRLGSSAVILSRTFHRQSTSVDELKAVVNLEQEIDKLKNEEERLKKRDKAQVEEDRLRLKELVSAFLIRKKNETSI